MKLRVRVTRADIRGHERRSSDGSAGARGIVRAARDAGLHVEDGHAVVGPREAFLHVGAYQRCHQGKVSWWLFIVIWTLDLIGPLRPIFPTFHFKADFPTLHAPSSAELHSPRPPSR